MEAPSFDVHRAESSRQHHAMEGIPLLVKRAESARQHVRALNTQFARWLIFPAVMLLISMYFVLVDYTIWSIDLSC